MFSIAKSRYTIPVQSLFFLINGLGVFLSVVYDAKTPDLYENNAHHKIGWIFSFLALVWILLNVVNSYAGRLRGRRHSGHQISAANMARYSRLQNEQDSEQPRWSGDSGQGTERNSYSLFGSGSPGTDRESRPFDETLPGLRDVDIEDTTVDAEKVSFVRSGILDRFLSRKIPRFAFGKSLKISRAVYTIIERLITIMGWIALLTGAVTFGGIFVCFLVSSRTSS
jgi:hypothetical protein